MMCDRCDRPIDPGDAKPYEVPGATGPGVTVYLCRSAATCCRRSARKRTRTRLAADLPPVPGRRRPGARRARSSSVSWASRSCVPVARLLALAFRWFPRDVAAAERSSFGHSWPLPGALGGARRPRPRRERRFRSSTGPTLRPDLLGRPRHAGSVRAAIRCRRVSGGCQMPPLWSAGAEAAHGRAYRRGEQTQSVSLNVQVRRGTHPMRGHPFRMHPVSATSRCRTGG